MLRARATVMHLGRTDIVNDGSSPTRRPMKAVEYNENTVERMTELSISAACLFTNCRQSNENQYKKPLTSQNNEVNCYKFRRVFVVSTFRCWNIEKANERITDPRNPIKMSPAPGFDETLVR